MKTTSVKEFMSPSRAAAVVMSLKKIRSYDMPKELVTLFNRVFTPLVYQLIACGSDSDPWYQPTDQDLEALGGIAFPGSNLYRRDADVRKIVYKLVSFRFSHIRRYSRASDILFS